MVSFTGHLPGPPRGAHAAARRVAGGAAGGAAGRRALPAGSERARRRPRPSTGRARSIACAASSRRPRRPTARRAGAAASRSPAWRCCGSRRATAAGRGGRDPPRAGRDAPSRPAARALLPACVEIMLATRRRRGGARRRAGAGGDRRRAGRARCSTRWRRRRAGRSTLAAGDARGALVALRRAEQAWRALDAPYEAARVRVLLGRACRALGDEDTAALELRGGARGLRTARRGAGPRRVDARRGADATA